nr:hypothetical protein [Rhodococcus kyotonensis]
MLRPGQLNVTHFRGCESSSARFGVLSSEFTRSNRFVTLSQSKCWFHIGTRCFTQEDGANAREAVDCHRSATQKATAMTATDRTSKTPFRVVSGFQETLPQMPVEQYPGTEGFIDDVFANPDGSEMSAGYFELKHTDAVLDYFYEYDEMKVVLEGEFRLENPDTGQVTVAKKHDAIFFPKGSRILFSTPDRALAYFVGHRSFAP